MGRVAVLLVISVVVAFVPFVFPTPVKLGTPPEDLVSNEKEKVEAVKDHNEVALSRPKRISSNRVSLQSLSGDVDKLRADATKSRRKRDSKSRVRTKRQAMFDYDDVDEVEPSVEEELASLSDEELSALAELVRKELNAYETALLDNTDAQPAYDENAYDVDSAVEPETARFVPVVIEDYANYDSNDEPNDEPLFGRSRRSEAEPDMEDYAVLIPSDPEVVEEDGSRIVLVPQAFDEEESSIDDEDLTDELELRSRIAELAEILNERVASGY
uniref:Uncharacterized protein n=1 Tax=Plectus sambesii TaxID=2011161 RepID=A0A914VEC9_9BILA